MNRISALHLSLTSLLLVMLMAANPVSALTDMQGKPVQLQNLVGQGQWTVIKIWASDCPACHKTIHYMTQFKQRLPEAKVLGISIDGQEGRQEALQFIRQYNLSFPNLLSDATEISDWLYANVGETLMGTPTTVVYNPQGTIAAVQPGAVTPDDLLQFIRRQQAETPVSD